MNNPESLQSWSSANERDEQLTTWSIKKEIGWLSNEIKEDVANQAFEVAEKLEIVPDAETRKIIEKIFKKCLENHPGIQEDLKDLDILSYQKNIYASHPELWNFLTFDMWINSFHGKKYADLMPTEKIQLIAFEKAMKDLLPLPIGLKEKDGSFNINSLRSRYVTKLNGTMNNVISTFKRDQMSNLGDIKKTLTSDYWLSPLEAIKFEKYLQDVKKDAEAHNVTEASIRWYVAAFIAGMAVALLWVMVYQNIFDPSWKTETTINEINLWDPSTLASLITAEQPFQIIWESTEKLYDDTNSVWLGKLGKDIINSMQSRTVKMSLNWKIWVEYNFNDGAKFTYSEATDLITVELPYPTFTIRESRGEVLDRNSEWFEVSRFNNTEQKLLESLNEKALQEISNQEELIDMSAEQASNIIYAIYGPVLEAHKHAIKWVVINIKGDPKGKREFLKD